MTEAIQADQRIEFIPQDMPHRPLLSGYHPGGL